MRQARGETDIYTVARAKAGVPQEIYRKINTFGTMAGYSQSWQSEYFYF
jgi:hypothetical protein